MTTEASPQNSLTHSRGWLIGCGVVSIIVGFLAMSFPLLFSLVIAQLIGIFALVTGVFSLGLAIFEKHTTHRLLNAVFALIRIAAGIALLTCIPSGVAVITLILAIFLIVEGALSIGGAITMRSHQGWVWILVNGIAALVLGVMVYSRWPADSAWILGLFYGINSLFSGMSLLMLGLGAPKNN